MQYLKALFKNRAVMDSVVAGLVLVIGSVILIIGVSISSTISGNPAFSCPTSDTNCASAKNLIGIIPIIAGAVMIIAGVWQLFPRTSSVST